MKLSRVIPAALLAVLLVACGPTAGDSTTDGGTNSGIDDGQNSDDAPSITVVAGEDAGITRVRFAAMGDMLPHGGVNLNARVGNDYNYAQYFEHIRHIYRDADLVYCNQEAPTAPGMSIQDYPRFNGPVAFARDLQKAGCNMVNLANNHSFDQRQEGASLTREVWEDLDPKMVTGVNRSAKEQQQVAITEVNGAKVAFLGYTMLSNMGRQTTWGLNHTDDLELLDAQLAEARKEADIVVFSIHWGVEYVTKSRPEEQEFAQYLADRGVDVILGMHAHVLQEVEWLERPDGGRTLVWYSLGNLLSGQITMEQRIGGVALFDVLVQDGKASVTDVRFMPTYNYFPYSYNGTNYVAGRGLEIRPLSDAAALFRKAGYKTSIPEAQEFVKNVLGPDVQIVAK